MRRLFLTAPVDVDLPPGWVRVDTPATHRAAFSPEQPGDYPLPRLLSEAAADAVVLVDTHRPPFYPRRLQAWSGLVVAHVPTVVGVRPACAYPWWAADAVVWAGDPEHIKRIRIPPVYRSIGEAILRTTG